MFILKILWNLLKKNSLDLIASADEPRLLSFQQFPIGPGYLCLQLLKYFICICNI